MKNILIKTLEISLTILIILIFIIIISAIWVEDRYIILLKWFFTCGIFIICNLILLILIKEEEN